MSVDILQQVISDICRSESGFAIQLNESTDVTNCAQLLIFVRYLEKVGVKEEFLMNAALEATTKRDDIFQMVNSFFKQHGLKWENLRNYTTDGAPAMLGRKSGFRARVMEVAPHVKFLHCMIHRFALSCKVHPAAFFDVLSLVIKMVNNVKGSALNSRLFKILCEDLGADHSVLLFHSNVRWLSRGTFTKRVYKLRKELLGFFQQSNKCETLVTSLRDDFFILILAYLVDIFDAQNMLNKNLQRKNLTVCEFIAKVKAFLAKLRLWRGNICSGTFFMFSTVSEFLCQNPQIETTRFSELVTEHLLKLEEIDGYFPSLDENEVAYLRNPFTANAQTLQAGTEMQEKLIELQHDGFARDVYSEKNLGDFWFTMCKSYKRIAEPANQALLLFPSTWLCESTFSVMLEIKSKYRSQLKTPEHDLRCAIANVSLRINELFAKKQVHSSH